MNYQFVCSSCQLEFEAKGKKLEYVDRLYGPCWKRIAACPNCKVNCDEVKKTSLSKKTVNFDALVASLQSRDGGCGGGGCCG